MSDLVDLVARDAQLGREDAERATSAVLETLAERLSSGEARHLAEQLPEAQAAYLHTTTGAEPFDYPEFLRRVAVREATDTPTAERHARAVFRALARTVDADELDDVAAELPQDFAPLIAEARHRFFEPVGAEAFLQKVAEHAGISTRAARPLAEAVLETLAERISGGEVDDLVAVLDVSLREPLQRGKEHSGGRATKMSLDEFLERVGKRLGLTPIQARGAVEAVFRALRETVPHDEFLDVTAELPYEYASVGARPRRV
jgi:uncharacterized protein (DUF2267 family)